MAHWKRQPHISTFQRSFIESTTFELQQWLLERARAAGAELLDPPIYTRHTWLEEMHDWLPTNALATSLVMLRTRMKTLSFPPSPDFEGQVDETHPSCLAVVIHGVLIGRFGAAPNIRVCRLIRGLKEGIRNGFNLDRFQTIWPHDHLYESSHWSPTNSFSMLFSRKTSRSAHIRDRCYLSTDSVGTSGRIPNWVT